MVEQLTLQTTISLLTLISLTIGVIYHIMTLNNTRKNQRLQLETRQAQLFMQIHSQIVAGEIIDYVLEIVDEWSWEDYDDYYRKYIDDKEKDAIGSKVAMYIEGIGVLSKRGLIDASLVDDLMSGMILAYWEKVEDVTKEYRRRANFPQASEWVEYLYYEIKSIAKEQHPEIAERRFGVRE
jgi:hypothetical protein